MTLYEKTLSLYKFETAFLDNVLYQLHTQYWKKNVGINSVFHDTTLYVICFTLTLPCCEHLNKEGYHLLIHYVTCTSIIANIRGDQFCHSLQVPLLICNIWSGGHLAPSQTASTCENNQLNYFLNLFQDSRINSFKNKRIACHQQVHLRVECPWDTLYFYTKQMCLVVVLGLKYTNKIIVKTDGSFRSEDIIVSRK